MPKAILNDTTKCIACRGCQVACKRWIGLDGLPTSLNADKGSEWTNPPDLTPQNYNIIRFVGIGEGDNFSWNFVSARCMHCLEPACVGACPVGAITKYEEGPVVIDEGKCIGCQYCVSACPFRVPRYDAEKNKTYKCTFCVDRLKAGLQPACTQACPTGALVFGERDEILGKAFAAKEKTGGYLYGFEEAAGTSVFIVSKAPPKELGLPEVGPTRPVVWQLREVTKPVGGVLVAATILATGAIAVIRRRKKVQEEGEGGGE